MDLKLDEIKEILEQPDFNVEQAFIRASTKKLLEKRNEIDRLFSLCSTNLTPLQRRDKHVRSAKKFEAFKQQKVQENEEKNMVKRFGKNMATKRLNKPTKKYLNLTEKDMQAMQNVEKDLFF